MARQAVEMLEDMIGIALNKLFPDTAPTEEEFMSVAADYRNRLQLPVSDKEFEQILRNLKSKMLVAMDVGVLIADRDSEHQSWLPARRAEIDWFYWNRYKRYLESVKGWNPRVTAIMDTITDEILDKLGDPKSDKPWRRRGLVIGDVQSGKTANYTAICNKAADVGYKVIIVLAGITDSLRIQTQERLDKEFSGRLSKHLLNKRSGEILDVFDGVGRLDKRKRIAAFTSVLYDFNSTILNSNDLTLRNLSEPALFVVKKNSKILSNLERWLRQNNADANGKINLPLLLIDDEADNASINTRKQDEEATAVNRAIRSILNRFTQASYLGITATPYANIFIDPDTTDDMIGDDLFPKDFIYLLNPPSNYIGPDRMFADTAEYRDSIEIIDKREIEQFFPLKHKKDLMVDELPSSLKEALGYFLLVNAIRDIRGDLTEHRSMLIHVSRFTDVQMRLADRVSEWLVQMRTAINAYAGLNEHNALQIDSIRFLKDIWDKHNLSSKVNLPWCEVQQQYLRKAVGPVEVRAVNSRTGASSLDYYAHKEGFRVIAVGGNSLSRGLTLEGLVVSYFYRGARMYDTLLQMGRWFGYRPGYDDLFKIWMTEETIDWYGFILSATNELKQEIRRMNQLNLTPMHFGLKVRQHPDSLIVTALNKMRTASEIQVPVSVQGQLLETPRLKAQPEVLERNRQLFLRFVRDMDRVGTEVESDKWRLWTGIPKRMVTDLLSGFETHPWHLSFQGPALADYIEKYPGLEEWDVVIPHGQGDPTGLDGHGRIIKIRKETRKVDQVDDMIRVMGSKLRVGSGGLTRAGLTAEQVKEVEESNSKKGKQLPDSAYLIRGRRPLLMLHVIQPDISAEHAIPDPLFAIGIGLPRTEQDQEQITATYKINLVGLRTWIGFDADEVDEDVD